MKQSAHTPVMIVRSGVLSLLVAMSKRSLTSWALQVPHWWISVGYDIRGERRPRPRALARYSCEQVEGFSPVLT